MECPPEYFIRCTAELSVDHDVPLYNSVWNVPAGFVGVYPPAAKAVLTVCPPATPLLAGTIYDPPNDHEEPFHSSESVK